MKERLRVKNEMNRVKETLEERMRERNWNKLRRKWKSGKKIKKEKYLRMKNKKEIRKTKESKAGDNVRKIKRMKTKFKKREKERTKKDFVKRTKKGK